MIDFEEKKCCFAIPNFKGTYYCKVLDIEECDGFNTKCSFCKTKDEFNSGGDKAIDICREKGICGHCKYRTRPCIKSYEIKNNRR